MTNNYINVNDISHAFKNLCNNKTSTFIDCKNKKVSILCKSINQVIDSIDYEHKYLNPKALKKIIESNKISLKSYSGTKMFSKGTIPYYFPKARPRQSDSNDSISVNTTSLSTNSLKPTPELRGETFFRPDNK